MTLTLRLFALLLGFCLDLLLGDPHWAPHPARGVGALIGGLEKGLRAVFPKGKWGGLIAGGILALLVPALSVLAVLGLSWVAGRISVWAAFAVETILCYQLLAARSLRDESMKVYAALKSGSLEDARAAVSMIVGRDTERLDEAGVARAAVETVAENASDGVTAPLLFLALGGAPLGMLYKAVNTMDSMVGYKNEKYLYFGRAAARLDDVLNWIPARLSGLLMCLAASPLGYDGANALRVMRRDHKNHKSPNSAWTEAAAAGALHIRLAGPAWYFGELVEKPAIGDADRPVEPLDILRANRLMYAAAFIALLLCCGLPLILLLL